MRTSNILASALFFLTSAVAAQVIDTVALNELGRYQHGYVQFPDSFSAPTLSSRLDRLGRPYLYMACNDSGLITLDITDPTTPTVFDRRPPDTFGGLYVSNLEQAGDLLYLALGGLSGGEQSAGLAILDVSDPSAPELLGQWDDGATYTHGAAIVKVHGDHAYLGAMEDGIIVLDISDPGQITFVSGYVPDPDWPGIANYPPNARGMAIRGNVLFLAYDAGALRAIDISDPGALTEIGRHLNPDHPALTNPAYNNIALVGDRAYCTIDYCGLEVVDISDPAQMVRTAWENPWNCFGLSWFGSDGHTNELITAAGDSLLFVSGADSELLVYDITEPDTPVLKGGHIFPNDTASTWGVDVFGDLVVGNFINNHGLPLQPYDSKFGGVVLFGWEASFTTSITNIAPRTTVRSVPNPSTGRSTLILPWSDREGTMMRVVDLHGRVVLAKWLPPSVAPEQHIVLDLEGRPDGLYSVQLQHGTTSATLRVMVCR